MCVSIAYIALLFVFESLTGIVAIISLSSIMIFLLISLLLQNKTSFQKIQQELNSLEESQS